MKRDLTEKEFNDWKDGWMREKGCPFFACSQFLFRKTCGKSLLCGVLFDYQKYKTTKWVKQCDVKLTEDKEGNLPTKICPSCTGSMCLKIENNEYIGKSWCKLMNDYYERNGYRVDRSWEKYILSNAVWVLPVAGEEAYLELEKEIGAIDESRKVSQ